MKLKSVGMGYFLAISDAISILNLVFGFLSILMVIDHQLTYASLCILIAVVFDSVDGWVSRKLNRVDPWGFGKNIDSLADVVSFGVAPSVILYALSTGISSWVGYIIAIIALFTLICGMLRLTRYNILADRINYEGFIGFPIPGTAILLATYYLSGLFNIFVAAILMFFAGYLMISTIRYPKFDNYYVIGIGAIMIALLIIPMDFYLGFINLPALVLFIFSLVYMFMTFLEFFIPAEEVFDRDKAVNQVTNVRELTEGGVSKTINFAKERINVMRDTFNQISSEDFDVGVNEDSENNEEDDYEKSEQYINTGEIIDEE